MRSSTPAQQLGMAANLTIFLGLLYTLLQVLAWLGVPMLFQGEYRLPGLGLALGVIGLGYGIRYGSSVCLYAALVVFTGLSLYFLALLVMGQGVSPGLRLVLSTWVCWRLWRALPAMQVLQHEHAFPLPMSRYGAFVLRHIRAWRMR